MLKSIFDGKNVTKIIVRGVKYQCPKFENGKCIYLVYGNSIKSKKTLLLAENSLILNQNVSLNYLKVFPH